MEKQAGRQVLEVSIGFVLTLLAGFLENSLILAAVAMFCLLYMVLQNGWRLGVISALVLSLTVIFIENGQLYHMRVKEDGLIIIGCIACAYIFGFFFHKKHGDVYALRHEFEEEKLAFTEAFALSEKENKAFRKQIKQGKASLHTAHELAVSLSRLNQDGVLNECARILKKHFQAESVGIYHLDSVKNILHVQVRIGAETELPQTFLLDESSFFQKMMQSRTVTWNHHEEEDTPLLAIPIVTKGCIEKVIIIPEIHAYRSSDHCAEFLQPLLQIITYYYETADKMRDHFYPGTHIHHMTSFQYYVEQERERLHLFHQPFVCVGMYVRGLEEKHLPVLEDILRGQLCELDQIAYNSAAHMVYVLLPGTDVHKVGELRKQIEELLKEKHIFVINWTVLQNEEAV
jgi:hypothetical protein